MEPSAILRPAAPTTEEGEIFAHHLNVAADGAFRAMLGGRMARIIGQAYTEPGHDLSYEHVTFAELDGAIVGMASGYTAAQHRSSSEEPLRAAAGFRFARMELMMAIGRSLFQFIETVPDGDYYLQAVAVDETQRGSGVGSMLIDHCALGAIAAGSTRLALDVVETNDAARRLYERRGMQLEATSPRVLFLPGTRAHRMVKRLDA